MRCVDHLRLTALVFGIGVVLSGCGGGRSAASLPPVSSDRGTPGTATVLGEPGGRQTDAVTAAQILDGAAAAYPMSDGASVLTDYGPYHANGTQGASVVKHVAPLNSNVSQAVMFPGGANNLAAFDWTLPKPVLQPTAALTVEMWVNLSQLNASGANWTLLAYGQNAPAYSLQVTSPYDNLSFSVATGAGTTVTATGLSRLAPGKTYQIAATYDGTKAQLYLNGVAEGAPVLGSGAISYAGAGGTYGLSIGGQPLSTIPQISGTVGDVAIYPTALPASTVLQHYVSVVGTPTVTVTPIRSQQFVDSIGVNTHFARQESHWETDYAQLKAMLVTSRITHIRDALDTSWSTYYDRAKDLAASGIRGDVVMEQNATASQVQSDGQKMIGFVEDFEGLNEPDKLQVAWVPLAQTSQTLLWNAVKTTPALALFPVVGTDVTSPQAAQQLGDLSAYLDYGNLHNYYNRDNPGNDGTGMYHPQWGGWGGSATYALNWVKYISGSKPVMSTETGYSTASTSLNTEVEAKYIARLLLEQYRAGIRRTYLYELTDEPYTTGNNFCYNGLIDITDRPKPSYYAVQSLIATLADPGPTFATVPLTFTFKGDIANLHYLVMQRRDGSYQIAYWLEVADWDRVANVEIVHPAQQVSLTLPFTPTLANNTVLDLGGHPHTSSQTFVAGTAHLTASDTVSILTVRR